MRLYHGSKNGIEGAIGPKSREICDFGVGFYTGDMEEQRMGLIASWNRSRFYELNCDLEGLSVLEFGDNYDDQIDWALYIGYHRMRELYDDYEKLRRRYEDYDKKYDVIVGLIANDKIYELMDEFFDGGLCDKALIEGLQRARLGKQYVFKTESACRQLQIISERGLTRDEIKRASVQNDNRKKQMSGIIGQLKTKYRRAQDIKYYDEILEEWNA